jgi:hypothetical protein
MENNHLICSIKDRIIYNTLCYLKTKEADYKTKANDELKELAKHYNLTCVKAKKYRMPLYNALENFIINKSGYVLTVNQMFTALNT